MKTVLIVDDEASSLRLVRMNLERAGFAVETASDGEAALDRLSSRSYDALVTDIVMPRMTGRELVEAVRKQSVHDGLPIFVVSSRPEDEFRDWTSELSGIEFLEKPLSLRKLVSRLEAVLGDETGANDPPDSEALS